MYVSSSNTFLERVDLFQNFKIYFRENNKGVLD